MPDTNEIKMRNKAIISLNLLTTPRISALASARIESVKYMKDMKAWASRPCSPRIPQMGLCRWSETARPCPAQRSRSRALYAWLGFTPYQHL